MQDYGLNRSTRRCSATDRPFEPGERYYSAVVELNGELKRVDYCEAAWSQYADSCVGWWRSRMPVAAARKRVPAPVHVLLDTLNRLTENPDDAPLAFVLSVLLLRRRVLVETVDMHEAANHADQPVSDASHFTLHYPVDDSTYVIPNQPPLPQHWSELQNRLTELLFSDEVIDEETEASVTQETAEGILESEAISDHAN